MKQNIEAIVPDQTSNNEDESEFEETLFEAAYTEIRVPLPPLRKREWKGLHKEITRNMQSETSEDAHLNELLMWASL